MCQFVEKKTQLDYIDETVIFSSNQPPKLLPDNPVKRIKFQKPMKLLKRDLF